VLDRTLGKPTVAITGPDGGAIRHEHAPGLSPRALDIMEEIRLALEGADATGANAERDLERARTEQLGYRCATAA
jgi:hypothetical protein